MNPTVRKKYNPLGEQIEGTQLPPNSWSFYLVMVACSIIIVSFISAYLYTQYYNELVAQSNLFLAKDFERANLYSKHMKGNLKTVSQKQIEHKGLTTRKKMVCYYNIPSTSPSDLQPKLLDPHLCTHINVAFATIVNKTIFTDANFEDTLKEVVLLKNVNSNLKILVSIGGAGSNNGYPEMVENHASRKIFIKSIKSFLLKYHVDGIDLDWEFPGLKSPNGSEGAREKQHFVQLLDELRKEFVREKKNYLLTIAVAAPQIIVDQSYKVNYINEYVDFINIMTYDFHFYTPATPFTGLNSPLYSSPNEKLYMSTLNINYTTNLYLSLGMERSKIVIGIPTYGHTFTLVNRDNGNVESPASGYGSVGNLGFASLPQICFFLRNRGHKAKIVYDKTAQAPYLHDDYEWISFEDQASVRAKANFIKENDFGGAMIYSLNCDDYSGYCSFGNATTSFPLTRSVIKYL